MKKPRPAARRVEPAVQFRGEIEKAEAAGLAREDMRLQLTHADASKLKRDASLAVADIRFASGAMWFLGVRVEAGGVPVSVLQHQERDSAAPEG